MTTDDYESLHELSPTQVRAVAALAGGATHSTAAVQVGVHRVTVTRWVNHHPAFIAELNQLRSDAVREAQEDIKRTTQNAIDLVSSAIDGGDVGVALRWLRLGTMSSLTAQPPGSAEPNQVVESVRRSLPSAILAMLQAEDEPTRRDAEDAIRKRLQGEC